MELATRDIKNKVSLAARDSTFGILAVNQLFHIHAISHLCHGRCSSPAPHRSGTLVGLSENQRQGLANNILIFLHIACIMLEPKRLRTQLNDPLHVFHGIVVCGAQLRRRMC